jgi:hypothetical protein
MINDYLRGRVCIEFIRGDLIQGSFWILSFSCSFPWFAAFRTSCWSCGFSLFYMTFLSFFGFFGLVVVLHGVLNSNFKLCAFCCQQTHQGGD